MTDDELSLPRAIIDLNTTAFAEAIDSGYWMSLDHHVQQFANRLLAQANSKEHGTLFYFGVEETPALIALGAYVGDEYRIECRDYDRDAGAFAWPNDAEPVSFESVGIPGETVEAAGDDVLMVELSYPVNPADVAHVIAPSERLATISIRPAHGSQTVGLLRSQGGCRPWRLAHSGETDLGAAIEGILARMGSHLLPNTPRVSNPVNPSEEFADKWAEPKHSHLHLEENFHLWLQQAQVDFKLLQQANPEFLVEQATLKFGATLGKERVWHGYGSTAGTAAPVAPAVITATRTKPWARG